MRLVVLGSGTAIPVAHRGASGYAVVHEGRVVCLECGPGSTRRWPAAGIALADVDAIAVTHHHVDHVNDLAAALFARIVHDPSVESPLVLAGPVGHAAHVRALHALHGEQIADAAGTRRVVELADGDALAVGALTLTARVVRHTEGALGYRVSDGARTLAYSGDSGPCDALVALCRGADLALLECSYPSTRQSTGHLTPRTAGETARDAGVRRLALTHFYPSVEATDIERDVRAAGYDGALQLVRDLDVLDL